MSKRSVDTRSSEDDDAIRTAAGRWKALLESGEVDEATQREFDSWLDADIRHTTAISAIDRGIAPFRTLTERGMLPENLYRLISKSRAVASPLTITPLGPIEDWPGGEINAEGTDNRAYRTNDGTVCGIAPGTRASIAFDGVVRTVTLSAGSIVVNRSADAAGVLLIKINAAIGGCVRVLPDGLVLVEIDGAEAVCNVARGQCVVTMESSDFEVTAGSGAVFNSGMGRVFELDLVAAFGKLDRD